MYESRGIFCWQLYPLVFENVSNFLTKGDNYIGNIVYFRMVWLSCWGGQQHFLQRWVNQSSNCFLGFHIPSQSGSTKLSWYTDFSYRYTSNSYPRMFILIWFLNSNYNCRATITRDLTLMLSGRRRTWWKTRSSGKGRCAGKGWNRLCVYTNPWEPHKPHSSER